MKIFKRNAVIITVLLFVCAAVYLNWSYNKKDEKTSADTGKSAKETDAVVDKAKDISNIDTDGNTAGGSADDAGLYYVEDGNEPTAESGKYDEYFAEVRLERQQARDDAAETLQTVAAAEGASQETIDSALANMAKIAEYTVKEAEIENLIRAKGFIDCVVYLSDGGASVTVAAEEGLSDAAVARITDIIVTETDFAADQLKVIEIK